MNDEDLDPNQENILASGVNADAWKTTVNSFATSTGVSQSVRVSMQDSSLSGGEKLFSELHSCWNALRTPSDWKQHDESFAPALEEWERQIESGMSRAAMELWRDVIEHALAWEKACQGRRIHKGTAYYFAGGTAILNRDFDQGFLLMHQAVEEDRRTCEEMARDITDESQKATKKKDYVNHPAYYFVTLNDTQTDQFFKQEVVAVANYLKERITAYVQAASRKFSIEAIRSEFLLDPAATEETFAFVRELFRLKAYEENLVLGSSPSPFRSIFLAESYFQFGRIVECLLRRSLRRNNLLGGLIRHFAKKHETAFQNMDAAMTMAESLFPQDCEGTLRSLLDHRYAMSLVPLEECLLLVYGLRNFGGHRIEEMPILGERFPEIRQNLLNAIFCILDLSNQNTQVKE